MGFTPRETQEMTLWEYSCCCSANSKKSGQAGGDIKEDRLRDLGIKGF